MEVTLVSCIFNKKNYVVQFQKKMTFISKMMFLTVAFNAMIVLIRILCMIVHNNGTCKILKLTQ